MCRRIILTLGLLLLVGTACSSPSESLGPADSEPERSVAAEGGEERAGPTTEPEPAPDQPATAVESTGAGDGDAAASLVTVPGPDGAAGWAAVLPDGLGPASNPADPFEQLFAWFPMPLPDPDMGEMLVTRLSATASWQTEGPSAGLAEGSFAAGYLFPDATVEQIESYHNQLAATAEWTPTQPAQDRGSEWLGSYEADGVELFLVVASAATTGEGDGLRISIDLDFEDMEATQLTRLLTLRSALPTPVGVESTSVGVAIDDESVRLTGSWPVPANSQDEAKAAFASEIPSGVVLGQGTWPEEDRGAGLDCGDWTCGTSIFAPRNGAAVVQLSIAQAR